MEDRHLEITTTTDDRDYVEKQIQRYQHSTGRKPSAQDLATEFAKITPMQRISELDDIDRELKKRSGPLSLAEAAEEMRYSEYVNALRGTHEKLRKVGR